MADAASAMTLGTAIVEIGGDLTKLLASFQQAKSYRDQFEKQMADGSDGLLKFEKAANDTGTALDRTTQTSKTASDQIDKQTEKLGKLTAAELKAAEASKVRSAAIETEAQKTARISAMVDASLAKLQQSNLNTGTIAPKTWEKTAAPLFIPAAALAGESAVKDAAKDADALAVSLDKAGKSAHVSSLSIRELVVLAREGGRGDFSRMAGSATLLAQSFGLIEKAGLPLILTLGAVAAATAVVGVAFIKGADDATKMQNVLSITGNYAGLTAASFEDMAARVAKASDTSIGSAKDAVLQLAQSSQFTSTQIESLATSAELLSRATGQSATDVLKDFEKMSEGPTKYAEVFQRTHAGILTPLQISYIRTLEDRGNKEQAIATLIEDLQDGITKNTVKNTNLISGYWHYAINSISAAWDGLKTHLQGGNLGTQIQTIKKQLSEGGAIFAADPGAKKQLEDQLAALESQAKAQNDAAEAKAKDTRAAVAQESAIEKINQTYLKGIDAPKRYQEAVDKLNNTIADSVQMARGTSMPTLLAAAAKSADPAVRDLASHYAEAVDKIKKQELPVEFKASTKAANAAASAAKKLADQLAALADRRAEYIKSESAENAVLEKLLPLYANQSLSLNDIKRAKGIVVEQSRLKLTADSAEGKAVADVTGKNYDLNASIDAQTKMREQLNSADEKNQGIQDQIKYLGLNAGALAAATFETEALAKAKKDGTDGDADFIAKLKKDAQEIADSTDALAHAKFTQNLDQSFDKSIANINAQAQTLDMGREAAAAYTYQMEQMNAALDAHITLSPAEIMAIDAQAEAFGKATDALGKLKEKEDATKFANQQLSGAIDDVILGSNSLSASILQLSQSFAKATLDAALFGQGPLAGIFGSQASTGGGGGLLGGLGKLLGGFFPGGGSGGGLGIDTGAPAGFSFSAATSGMGAIEFHQGTASVGAGSGRPRPDVSPAAFIGAPRFHNGLGLQPGEFPAILQQGEKVTPRSGVKQAPRGGTTIVQNIYPKDYDSFRRTRRQNARALREAFQ